MNLYQLKNSSQQFHELSFYTLSHGDPKFIHQHAVDAYAVQTADENTKPIALIFGLAGLYLLIEKNFSGREVQRMHVLMSQNKKHWPQIKLPDDRGVISVGDVLATSPGSERDELIFNWCESVWRAFADSKRTVVELMSDYLEQWKARTLKLDQNSPKID